RIHDVPWVGSSEAHVAAARELGQRADALALRTPLPSSSEVREALATVAASTPLAGLAAERLIALAAEASRTARTSARLELYPKGLPAVGALKLVAAVLPGEITPDVVRAMVARRYPDAASLPERPELDALAAELDLDWDNTRECYRRRGVLGTTSGTTE